MLSEERFTFHTPYIMILVAVVIISAALMALEQQHAEGEASANDALGKFEDGFYDKIQGLIHETATVDIQIPGDVQGKNHGYPAARDPVRYYHIIIQIDGDGEEEVRLNKRSAVDMLEAAGARDIVPADVLSFVTASVPVTEISGLSLLGEVHMLGDGEIPTISQTDTARQTIRAATADLAGFSENIINGSGVTVAIIDHGIYHVNLNSKVDARIYCPTGSCTIDGGSNPTTLSEGELDKLLSNNAVHGTLVSQIVAASDLPAYNGIAPGVRLLDGYSPTRGAIIRALDWALTEGADVAQLSISVPSDTCVSSYVLNAAINQAVSKGMVVVSAAGNDGKVNNAFAYHTVEEPSCAQNVISVGGINDRPANPILYLKSSLGPVTSTIPRLVPHLVAPAYGINVLAYSSSSNHFYAASGTSFAAPMVSAAAAMMLQLNPDLAPAETKSLLLLGSDWTGPVPCTSTQYEAYNPSDNCSHTARQDYGATPTLETLNHVGFGVLDVAKSLRYAANSSSHVISSNLDLDTRSMWYGLNVTEPLDQTKVSLTWLVPFFFNHNTIDLDFTVTCPGSSEIIRAKSNHQTVEFAVFEPVKARVCAVHITTPHSSGIQNFTLASTHPLGPPPSEFIESDIVVSSDDDGTYVLNERIVITAEFPRAVQVKSTSQPYLELNMTSAVRHATYTGINADGTVLSFEYAMQEGDASADLSYTGMNALVVPDGGNVTDAYTGIPVRPVLSVPGEAGSLSATRDIVINTGTGAPSITAVTLHDPTSQITSNTALVFGVTFSESVVNVDQSDFVLSSGSGTVTGVTGTGSSYLVNVAANSDGIFDLDMSLSNDVQDISNNDLSNVDPRTSNDQTYTVSSTAPSITAITRHDPISQTTLVFEVMFSEDVTGVDAADFALSPGSTGAGSIVSLTGSGSRYLVSVSATQDGTYNLDLVSPGHGIVDATNSPLAGTDPIGDDYTYTVDTIAPTVTSIERNYPTEQITDSQMLVFEIAFNENVAGVDAADFVISPGSTGEGNIANLTGSGNKYLVDVSATQDGTYNLDLVSSGHGITDTADNPLTDTAPVTEIDHTYTVNTIPADTTAPTLESIQRSTPATANTDSQTLVYKATFSEDVTGITVSDFTLSSDSAGGESTSTSTGQFTQTRSPNLDIPDLQTVSDTITVSDSETATSVSVDVDITHNYIGDLKIDLIAPDGISRTLHDNSGSGTNNIDKSYAPLFGSIPISGVWTLQIHDNYDADPGVLNSWTLTINYGDTATTASSVTGISGSGDAYYVTVSATQDGTYNLDLVSSGHDIEDAANNSLTNVSPTGADETYTVSTAVIDDTAPTLESIQRSTPATANTDSQTLVYKATFSEDVTGITVSDFILSSDSAGGESTSTSTGQFTQTRSPNLDIPDLQTVSDTITVSDSETATSVSVDVDITHNYIGDLKIDLIAPDGISRTLHDNSGSGTNNIDKSYAPLFGSIPISGVWTLQIHDNYDADPGVLNSWTLTINYGDTATTASSVTDVSGSGDAYYVTVSATQDGAYNLDLVSSGHDIEDAANNSLTNVSPTGADETYTVSTAVIDDTAPTLESIQRSTPATANTDSQTLVYKATFSEDVTGITVSDFTLSSDSAGGESTSTSTGQFTQTRSPHLTILDLATVSDTITVPDSETATSVSVDVDITHNYIGDLKIDLIAPDGTSRTLHDNSGSGTNNIDKSYAPLFGSIPISGVWTLQIHDNYDADPGVLNSWTLTINYGDTATTASSVTDVSGSGDAYYVTVSATQDGAYNLDLVSSGHDIEDAANNSLTNVSPTGADETYTVSTAVIDDTAPTLESIERSTPATQDTDSQTLVYKATFSEDVTGITVSDFTLSSDSAGGESTSTSTGQFTQTRSPHLTILDLATVSDTITVPDSETATSVSVDVDITHNYIGDLKIDLIAPDGTSRTLHDNSGSGTNNIDKSYAPLFGSIPISGVWTLQIHDNYDADPGVLNSWTLTINYGDTATTASSVTDVSGSGDAYYVTVSATQDGAYNLDLVSSGHDIEDAANNSLTNASPTGADETYTVSTAVIDDTAPTLASIERYSPATENTDSQTLVYEVTFSEDVTEVDTDDFALSSDSTGGGNNNNAASSEQFTQTRSPSSPITDNHDTSDAITVPNSGTVTSVSVTVNISHTYIGDLKVELVAPDGTLKTLHNRSGGGTDNIITPYTPDFDDAQIQGIWKLKIRDGADGDTGTLNSWTLEVNYDTVAATTVSSVTDISGSGDVYHVTVSATQDGTYNLDLVSSGHNIADAASNPLTNTTPTETDETYTVTTN